MIVFEDLSAELLSFPLYVCVCVCVNLLLRMPSSEDGKISCVENKRSGVRPC